MAISQLMLAGLQTLEISQSMIPEFKDYAKNRRHCLYIVLLEYYYCSWPYIQTKVKRD